MMRVPGRVVLGITAFALLAAPAIALAQVGRGDTASARQERPRRGFRSVTFGVQPREARPMSWPTQMGNPFLLNEGVRLPSTTVAPQPHGSNPPDCGIRVVPVDPSQTPRMPVVKGEVRVDPKFAIKVPECKPRQ